MNNEYVIAADTHFNIAQMSTTFRFPDGAELTVPDTGTGTASFFDMLEELTKIPEARKVFEKYGAIYNRGVTNEYI